MGSEVRCGLVWNGMVCSGVVWRGAVWCGLGVGRGGQGRCGVGLGEVRWAGWVDMMRGGCVLA